ncbi:MAG: hypothetical protein COU33_02950 [Candidatus Magasanikbacteria bacterium CG10_big_fil_rev_8_21_14_0_10_43_6]|uniref:PEP-utilising enzyme mobile domain-containing protein n=1 Tax=Candidatus Magasanikbacteria bacterium CG10_big_fil_rev_8_21_14_0_10_43_6 TaxID=1974650 RepID=A0A2M6W104_9BACT|nr:MAG: hypothetical protein COU33_02950 [Candidatus Magasanikbacteria bacterium CG10_big_fil_rev_8_21_14_0_10_43_6]
MKKITEKKWIKHWAGRFNVHYNSALGFHNTFLMKHTELNTVFPYALYIYRNKYTAAYFEETSYHAFGQLVAKKILNDIGLAQIWSEQLRQKTDAMIAFTNTHYGKQLRESEYKQFLQVFHEYNTWHRPVKVVVDFLPDHVLEKVMPVLSKARVYAEPAYEQGETFMMKYLELLATHVGYAYESMLCLDKDEVETYIRTGVLPLERELLDRYNGCIVFCEAGKHEIIVGDMVRAIEHSIAKVHETNVLTGRIAYPGSVIGRVRIVFDPHSVTDFNEGDILITGMTRPEYLPLMKKAGAFVTDAGGMLSHAAITARELQTPCIVGTEIATTVLQEGDIVEVDANAGVVHVLK